MSCYVTQPISFNHEPQKRTGETSSKRYYVTLLSSNKFTSSRSIVSIGPPFSTNLPPNHGPFIASGTSTHTRSRDITDLPNYIRGSSRATAASTVKQKKKRAQRTSLTWRARSSLSGFSGGTMSNNQWKLISGIFIRQNTGRFPLLTKGERGGAVKLHRELDADGWVMEVRATIFVFGDGWSWDVCYDELLRIGINRK